MSRTGSVQFVPHDEEEEEEAVVNLDGAVACGEVAQDCLELRRDILGQVERDLRLLGDLRLLLPYPAGNRSGRRSAGRGPAELATPISNRKHTHCHTWGAKSGREGLVVPARPQGAAGSLPPFQDKPS